MLARHVLLGTCIAASLLAVLLYQPRMIKATVINTQQTLSQHATDRLNAIATLALQNHDLGTISKQLPVHLPIINTLDVYYRADGQHDLEATTLSPFALIAYDDLQKNLENGQTECVTHALLNNGRLCPIEHLDTKKIEASIVHTPNERVISDIPLRTRTAYAEWIHKLPESVTQKYSLNILDKTRFILAAHDKNSELWCTNKTTLAHIVQAPGCIQKSIESSKERRPRMRIADLRTPRTIIIKNKSKGWVIV